ncbi:MAG: glutaredoxin 3 [Arenimonas sp.]
MFRAIPIFIVAQEKRVSEVIIYSTAMCPYCVAAKNFLKSRGASYTEVRIDTDPVARTAMMEKTRRSSVPQIFINGTHVGGYDELVALDRSGGLRPLLDVTP